MLRTFNCGIGAILVCSPEHEKQILNLLAGEKPVVIGKVNALKENSPRVNVLRFPEALEKEMRQHVPTLVEKLSKPLKKVGVLISGSGTNLQALIDATRDPTKEIGAEIVLVISNKKNVEGLKRAERAGIKTKVFYFCSAVLKKLLLPKICAKNYTIKCRNLGRIVETRVKM